MKNNFLAGFIILFLMATLLVGQSIRSQIFGNVKNEDGKALAGVKVTVTNIKNNAVIVNNTGKNGAFRFLSLAPGVYQVSFDLEGYQANVFSGIQLSSEQSITLRVKLKKNE